MFSLITLMVLALSNKLQDDLDIGLIVTALAELTLTAILIAEGIGKCS